MMGEKRLKDRADGQTSFRRAWEVLYPYLLYYLVFNSAYIILAFAYQSGMEAFGEGYRQFMRANADTVSGTAEGLCRMLAILPLVPMLKKELRLRGEEHGLCAAEGEERNLEADRRMGTYRGIWTGCLVILLALCASLGLNVLLALTGFVESSVTYQQVADRQYGVAFGIGLLLYGFLSPLAEEVVFRGVIYNRLRRYFGPLIGIAASALFFGAFHGNLVQGVYGTCMGLLIAYVYECQGSFLWPVLFHAVSNLAVYTTAHVQAVQKKLFTPWGCVILLAVAAVCLLLWKRMEKR